MKPALALMTLLLLGFILWLGRPYQIMPDCTTTYLEDRNKNGGIVNCGNRSFFGRVDDNLIELVIHGRPVIANLKIMHDKNCAGNAIYPHDIKKPFFLNTRWDGENGDICLDVTAIKKGDLP